MRAPQTDGWTRRRFLGGLTLAGTAGLLGVYPRLGAAEPPPETTTLRLGEFGAMCTAPQYVAEELLRSEGFTDVQYVRKAGGTELTQALASGEVDLAVRVAWPLIMRVDAGDPVVVLAGVHVSCFELFGTERVRAIRDLKGKAVAVPAFADGRHIFLSTVVAYVGLDPRQDIHWVTHPPAEAMRLLAEGKIDAFLGFPPEPQELRAKQIGHVLLNTAVDHPWSQYFCCMVAAHGEFVRKYRVASKRAVRAILKANDICALEPERVAQALVDKGVATRYDEALQTMKDLPYARWREYDPEDTVRFYALRLQEVGMIQSSPQKIIAQGTDWRFLNELKKELKG
jgi:NitT/TauT family transport system substrate-binding protein